MNGAVAFVCAMPMELAAVVSEAGLHRSGGSEVHRGSVGRHEVVAIATGMGTDLARAATNRVCDEFAVAHVLVVGIAGGVDTATPIGTVVRPEVVIDHGTGDELRPVVLGDEPAVGALWTTDVITTPHELVELRVRGVVALDMETASIGRVCDERGIPWSVFRAISDDPSDAVDEELFGMANQDGSPNAGRVIRYVLRHPGRVPRLARMGRNCNLAARRAALAAVNACRELA